MKQIVVIKFTIQKKNRDEIINSINEKLKIGNLYQLKPKKGRSAGFDFIIIIPAVVFIVAIVAIVKSLEEYEGEGMMYIDSEMDIDPKITPEFRNEKMKEYISLINNYIENDEQSDMDIQLINEVMHTDEWIKIN
jgi:hypothetical protein